MKKSWKSSIIGRWDDGRDVARDEKFCCFPRKTAFLHHSFTKNKQSWSFSMATTAFLSREKRRKRVILTFPRVGKAGFFRFLMILPTEFAVFAVFWRFRPRNLQFSAISDDSVHGICSFFRFFARRGAPKHSFCCFSLVGVPRNAVFEWFCLSPGWGNAENG